MGLCKKIKKINGKLKKIKLKIDFIILFVIVTYNHGIRHNGTRRE